MAQGNRPDRVAEEIRQHQCSEQVDDDRLREHDREREERPVLVVAQAEHRPPRLHGDHQHEDRPRDRRPVRAQSRACLHEPAETLQHLGDREAEDDRQQDREIVEGVHY